MDATAHKTQVWLFIGITVLLLIAGAGFLMWQARQPEMPPAPSVVTLPEQPPETVIPEAGALSSLSGNIIALDEQQHVISLESFDSATLTVISRSFQVTPQTTIATFDPERGVFDIRSFQWNEIVVGEAAVIFYSREEKNQEVPLAIRIEIPKGMNAGDLPLLFPDEGQKP